MTYKSLVEISTAGSYMAASRYSADSMSISTIRPKTGVSYMSVSIGPVIAQQLGLQKGDKVDLLYDSEDRAALIRRDNSGRMVHMADSGRSSFQIALREGMPYFKEFTLIKDWNIKDNELIFEFPKTVAVFSKDGDKRSLVK